MPAVVTTAALPAPISQTGLAAFFASQLDGIVGALFDQYSSGSQAYVVFKRTMTPGTKVGYIRVSIGNPVGTLVWEMFQAWNAVTHTGTLSSATAYVAMNSTSQLDILKISHPELSGYIGRQGSDTDGLLVARPAGRSEMWSDDLHYYIWLVRATNLGIAAMQGDTNPYGAVLAGSIPPMGLTTAMPSTGKREVAAGVILSGQYGVYGAFGPDIRQVAGQSLAVFDTVQVTAGVEECILLRSSAPFLAIRSI